MTSPTQRSLKLLRSRGYFTAITERWNPFAKIRQDLFGFIDLLALRGNETLAVQTTSGYGNGPKRIAKIRLLQASVLWLESPSRRIVVHEWVKRGTGKVKKWECRETELSPVLKANHRSDPTVESRPSCETAAGG